MSKEITVFVVDLSSTAQELRLARTYLENVVTAKILKGRKTDYVSVVAAYSPTTEHAYASQGMFKHVEVLCHKEVPTYQKLRRWSHKLVPSPSLSGDAADCFDAFMIAAGLLNDTLKLKFVRNIVVFTNARLHMSSWATDLAAAAAGAVNALDINVVVGIPEAQKNTGNALSWRQKVGEFRHGAVADAEALAAASTTPPLKRVRPIRAAKEILQLRFGADVELATANTSDYDPATDSICLEVEVYPAVKPEKPPPAHQYLVGTTTSKVKTETSYHIKGEEGNDNVPVDKGDWVDGFKYSTFDLIAVDDSLRNTATLKTETGLDVLGFIHRHKVPIAYLTSESYYVVPTADSRGNATGLAALCQAMVQLDTYAVARYVQKANDEVQLCVLMPVKVAHKHSYIHAFTMARLPFKEDERMGRFPKLSTFTTSSGKKAAEPKDPKDVDAVMEEFILAKDLDAVLPPSSEPIVANFKATMRETLSLPVETTSEPTLLPSSPAIQKYNQNLKKIIAMSLDQTSLSDFLEQESFVEKHMSKEGTNLFNLANILATNGAPDWLVEVNRKSKEASQKLLDVLAIEYTSKRALELEKEKKKWNSGPNARFGHGTYGAQEGPYEEELELDQLLGE